MSPTVLRVGPYRFFFYSREETKKHIHIEESNNTAKFWLEPVELAESHGFSTRDLKKLEEIVNANKKLIIKEWREFHGEN